MANKYLEKIAGDVAKAYVSPAWMEASIAKQHGKQSPNGVWKNISLHTNGNHRAHVDSIPHTLAGMAGGGLVGGGLGAIAGKIKGINGGGVVGAAAGLATGLLAGVSYGTHKSYQSQAKELHEKYKNKD